MTNGQKNILIFFGVIGVVIFVYFLSYPVITWNQKLTVEVETPEGVVSGSSVVKAIMTYKPNLLPEASGASKTIRGEATVIELPNGRYLFVLLGDPIAMAQHSFAAKIGGSADARLDGSSECFSKLSDIKESVPLLRGRYPLFVTFDDLDDPASVKEVDPDDFAATFGEGHVLRSVTLEITNDGEIQEKIEKLFPWFAWPREKSLEYGGGTNPLKMPNDSPRGYSSLSKLEFKRGTNK